MSLFFSLYFPFPLPKGKVTCGNFGCLPPGWEITWVCDEDAYLRLRTCIRVAQRLKSNGFFYCINQWSRQSLSCSEKPIRVNHKILLRDTYYCGPITVVVDAAGNTDEIEEFYVSQSYNGRTIYALRESEERLDKVAVMQVVGEWKDAVFHSLAGETTDELRVSQSSYGTYCHRPDQAS